MFIGVRVQEEETTAKLYYKSEPWFNDIFAPIYDYIYTIELKVSGKTYSERKNDLQEKAIEYSHIMDYLDISIFDLLDISNFFEKNGKRYGLLSEFKENAIC